MRIQKASGYETARNKMKALQKNTESVKIVLNVEEISEEQIRKENREYNPSVWDQTIDRYIKFKDCKFYVANPQKGYEYKRYYAVYELPEGMIIMKSVSYSSSLSNRGFCRISIFEGTVTRILLKDVNGKEGYCENDKENRKICAKNSQKVGAIFSTEF